MGKIVLFYCLKIKVLQYTPNGVYLLKFKWKEKMKIQTSVRVEDSFYKEAKAIFTKFGLSFGDAVNIFMQRLP